MCYNLKIKNALMQNKKHLLVHSNRGFSGLIIIISLASILLGFGIAMKFFSGSSLQSISTVSPSPAVTVMPVAPRVGGPLSQAAEPIKQQTVTIRDTSVSQPPVAQPLKAISTKNKVLAFALTSAGPQSAGQVGALLDNSAIDGVALQIGWPTLETSDEVFDWRILDESLKAAKDRNKNLTIHVFSGAGLKVAPWLKATGVQTYTLTDFQGRTHEEALPWDEKYLSQYAQFLKSLAAHIAGAGYSGTVARLSVAVPVAEMDLIACRDNMLAGKYAYDRATYLASWKTMIDAYAAAFPSYKKFVSAPVGLICYPDHDTQFFSDIMNYASSKYGTSFVPFAADLTSEGSDRMRSYTSLIPKLGLGYQTIWSATNDTSRRMKGMFPDNLLQAVCKAKSDGADYIEIYAVDVLNTDATLQKGIKAVHDVSLCN